MALTLVPFPAAAPTSITDWEDIIDIAEFNTLGVQGASQFNFSSNTIKQGTRIMIGGSVYLADADTAITGTPSDYIKITPAGATASAAYVSSLTGVSWNSVWNFWEDGSGNAYLFNEMKNYAGGGSVPRSAFAQYYSYGAYDELTTLGNTILARDGGDARIGTSSNPNSAQLYVSSLSTLGGVDGNYDILLQERYNPQSNNFYRSSWLVRNGAGTTWTTAVLHDAISIDTSFLVPRVSTRCWYERDPQNSSHAWGTSAITYFKLFNTGNAAIGTTVDSGPRLVVAKATTIALPGINANTAILAQQTGGSGAYCNISIIGGNAGAAVLNFGDTDSEVSGRILYDNTNNYFRFDTAAGEAMRLTATNHLLINTTLDPGETLHVGSGGARFTCSTHNFIVKSTGFLDNTWFDGSIYVDTIAEKTAAAGVTIDSVLLKDNTVLATTLTASGSVVTDTIAEKTASAGVSFNNTVKVDTIAEKTASAGVKVQAESGEYLKTKIIDIGDWNMDTTSSVIVTSGITKGKIRYAYCQIKRDSDISQAEYNLERAGQIVIDSSGDVNLFRDTSGFFDSVNFDMTSYNRGFITIIYDAS